MSARKVRYPSEAHGRDIHGRMGGKKCNLQATRDGATYGKEKGKM